MFVTYATVGRNIGTRPMSDPDWRAVREWVADVLRTGAGLPQSAPWECHTGTGTWEGVEEESAIITVLSETVPDLGYIGRRLAKIAERYGQDAIALASTTSTLVRPGVTAA